MQAEQRVTPLSPPSDIVDLANELADLAAEQTLPRFRASLAVADKSAKVGNPTPNRFDPVTDADREAEAVMVEAIKARFPDHGIVGEEHGTHQADRANKWVLDPVDGTGAFISGIPTWGTLIGFQANGSAVAGVMDQPYLGERFVTTVDGPQLRRRNGSIRQLGTSNVRKLTEATLTSTDPNLFSEGVERDAFGHVSRTARLTRYGLDCYGYCLVALGTIDAAVEAGLQAYDIAALVPIIEAAGGVVTTWDGSSPLDGGRIVAAANPHLHEEILQALNRG